MLALFNGTLRGGSPQHLVCAACAAGADADAAFRLYGEMRRDGVPLECQTFSALLNAFSAEVRLSPVAGLMR